MSNILIKYCLESLSPLLYITDSGKNINLCDIITDLQSNFNVDIKN